jgi:hypothetical protein
MPFALDGASGRTTIESCGRRHQIAFSATWCGKLRRSSTSRSRPEKTGVHDFEPLLTATLERFAHK